MKRCAFAVLLPIALVAGCAAGPDYSRPTLALPERFKEAPGWKPAQPRDSEPRGAWWREFDDAELDALEHRVDVSNPSLHAAVAGYDRAVALAAQARAQFFPVVTSNAAYTRGRSAGITGNSASVQFAASWEPDLFGRIRRSVEAASATAQASDADLETTRLALQAQLAQDYFLLRVADAQNRLLDDTVAAYARFLELTRNRFAAGVASRADVAAAESQLASAQAQRVDGGLARAQLEHAIAVLAGSAPADFSLPARNALPTAQKLPQIPALLPGELLERRPDIAAAERRAAAANAQIGAAQSAFFPTLSLAAGGGWRGPSFGDLLSAPNRVWSLGPALAATLLDAGARSAATAAARAGFEQAAANYRQTVLGALQEVEDNLAALRILDEEARLQHEAVRAASESLAQTTNQYKAGTVSYLNVITAQATLYTAQRTELDVRGRQLAANVALIRALGGGWTGPATASPPEPPVSCASSCICSCR
jgi:NodT family efflux transporter outer membrane factor (OMF) lipoprotein